MGNISTSDKTVIVTGGAGYIGSHACKALARTGYFPVSYDNLSRGHAAAVKWGPLEIGDILDPGRLDEVFHRYRPCAVMHFAALAYVGESVTRPMDYYRNNVIGSYTLLDSMARQGIDRIIFSSTCAIYGNPDRLPITEGHKKNPVNPYGNTKLAVEHMLADLSAADRLRFVSLRYFNAAGADPAGEIGENHEPETHLIPLVLQTASGTRSHIDVYGNDYDTPDGTCIRDYLHVTDLVNAHIAALEYILDGAPSDYFNLGTERGYSVSEIIKQAEIITGKVVNARKVTRRPGDPATLIADSTRARTTLQWKLEYSDLDTILKTAWDWHTRTRP